MNGKTIVVIILVLALAFGGWYFIEYKPTETTPTPSPTVTASPLPSQSPNDIKDDVIAQSPVKIDCNDSIFCLGDVFKITYGEKSETPITNSFDIKLYGISKNGAETLLMTYKVVNANHVTIEYEPKDTDIVGAYIVDPFGKTNVENFRFLTIEEMYEEMAKIGGVDGGAL